MISVAMSGETHGKKQRFKGDTGVISVAMQNDEPTTGERLRAPFPWFGGKSRVADLVWSRFGNVPNYVEPFAGSLAVLLGRPHSPRVETVNDKDAFLANFWRALRADPEHVAWWADWPVNEADLHARHRWLVSEGRERIARTVEDPDYYDCQIAGWWVWGQCLWIGSGWCSSSSQKPRLTTAAGNGVHGKRFAGTGNGHGACVHRRWQGGGQGGGSGVHASRLTAGGKTEGLYAYLVELGDRLRRVRVCVGDWTRVVTPSVTTYMGLTGLFLDPPYAHELREQCYAEDHDVSDDVRAFALEHGDDPNFRIALCGYDDEHKDAMPSSWECVPWKAHGGYSRTERGKANRERERIWFSPHCLRPESKLPFDVEAVS